MERSRGAPALRADRGLLPKQRRKVSAFGGQEEGPHPLGRTGHEGKQLQGGGRMLGAVWACLQSEARNLRRSQAAWCQGFLQKSSVGDSTERAGAGMGWFSRHRREGCRCLCTFRPRARAHSGFSAQPQRSGLF